MAVQVSLSARRLAKMVDELGALNAQMSQLSAQADAVKVILKACGADEVIGSAYRAKISRSESLQLDNALVKAQLSPAQIIACSKPVQRCAVSLYDL